MWGQGPALRKQIFKKKIFLTKPQPRQSLVSLSTNRDNGWSHSAPMEKVLIFTKLQQRLRSVRTQKSRIIKIYFLTGNTVKGTKFVDSVKDL